MHISALLVAITLMLVLGSSAAYADVTEPSASATSESASGDPTAPSEDVAEPTDTTPVDDEPTAPSDGTATHLPVGECPPWHPDDRPPVGCEDADDAAEDQAPAPAVEQRCSANRCVRTETRPDGTQRRTVTEYPAGGREEGL